MLIAQKLASFGPTPELDARQPAVDLNALHRTMGMQVLQLEIQLEEPDHGRLRWVGDAYRDAALRTRDLLARVPSIVHAVPDAVPPFDLLLVEALDRVYPWCVAQVADVRRMLAGAPTSRSTIPLEALSVFHDLSELCAASCDEHGKEMFHALRAVDDALYRLIDLRDRIARLATAHAR